MNSNNLSGRDCMRPHCTGTMVKRTSKTGDQFYGCSRFPYCRYTENLTPKKEDDRYPDGLADAATKWE